MTLSYDYSDLLREIHEELEEGIVGIMTTIQVLRADKPIYSDYRPVIDWYYDKKTQAEDFEPDPDYTERTLKRLEQEKIKYHQIKHKLEDIKVGEFICEMEYHTQIIK